MTTAPRFRVGDRVFVHGGAFRGETHAVVAVDAGPVPEVRVRARYGPDEPEEEVGLAFDQVARRGQSALASGDE